jgi:prepilin-type N-terminal cleavage/methylation domain-containing protein
MRELRRQRGFTLLEVMVSLVIVGGLLMTVIYTLNYNLGIAGRQYVMTDLINLANQKIEEMEKDPRNTQGRLPSPYDSLVYETKVKDSPFSEIWEISVAVGNGKEHFTLSELIRKTSTDLPQRGELK